MIINQHPNENDWKTTLKADNKEIKIHNKDLNNDMIQRELELERLDPGDVHHTLDYHLNIDSKNSATLTHRSDQICIRYINNIFITLSVTSLFCTGTLSIEDHNDIQRWLMTLSYHGYCLYINTNIPQSIPLWTSQSTYSIYMRPTYSRIIHVCGIVMTNAHRHRVVML